MLWPIALRVLCGQCAVLAALPLAGAVFGDGLIGPDALSLWWPTLFPTTALLWVLVACAGPDRWTRALPEQLWSVVIGASAAAIAGLLALLTRPLWVGRVDSYHEVLLVYWAVWSPALPAVLVALLRHRQSPAAVLARPADQSG